MPRPGSSRAWRAPRQFKSYFNKDIRDALAVDGDPFASAVNRIRQGADKLTGPFRLLGAKIAGSDVGQSVAGVADRLGVGFGKLTSAFDSNIKVLGSKVGNGFGGIFSKISDSKLVIRPFSSVARRGTRSAMSPVVSGLGDVFGGIGDIVGPSCRPTWARRAPCSSSTCSAFRSSAPAIS
ncbi:MAG: hypothetical protein ACLTKM_00045 [Bifidobacterium longum]